MSRIGVTWGSAKGDYADTRPPQRGPACGRHALPVFVTGGACPHAFWLEKVGRASRLPLEFGGGRRPQGIPRRPPATVWQPFGLAAQECPAFKGRRDACPTLRKCLGNSAPTRGGYAAANEDSGRRAGDGNARSPGDSSARTRNLARNARFFDVRLDMLAVDNIWLKATPQPLQCDIKATPKPVDSQLVGTP
jgi:hypothetical protein